MESYDCYIVELIQKKGTDLSLIFNKESALRFKKEMLRDGEDVKEINIHKFECHNSATLEIFKGLSRIEGTDDFITLLMKTAYNIKTK